MRRTPHIDSTVPVRYEPYDLYAEDEPDKNGLDWNTRENHIRAVPVLGSFGQAQLVADRVQVGQSSYWPNVPPVLPPFGYYWYNLGPIGRGMMLWKTYPEGYRPSPEEQKTELEAHRKKFGFFGGVPEGLPEALAEHGLSLDDSNLVRFTKLLVFWGTVWAGIRWGWKKLNGK
jgi:hypothetical protein